MTNYYYPPTYADRTSARRRVHLAAGLMGGGGLVGLLAFLALPLVDVPFLGSYPAPAVAGLLGVAGLGEAAAIVWVVPITALVLIGTAGLAVRPVRAPQLPTVLSLAMSTCTAGIYAYGAVGLAAVLSGATSSFLGAGFWLVLLAMTAAGAGAVVHLVEVSRSRS